MNASRILQLVSYTCVFALLSMRRGEAVLWIVSKLPEKEVDETQGWQAPIPIDGPLAPLKDGLFGPTVQYSSMCSTFRQQQPFAFQV